jgi:O-acetylhomoserine/O-acetylserine sulfhydrylase-like pyridoxal-dependent enzyme
MMKKQKQKKSQKKKMNKHLKDIMKEMIINPTTHLLDINRFHFVFYISL